MLSKTPIFYFRKTLGYFEIVAGGRRTCNDGRYRKAELVSLALNEAYQHVTSAAN